MSFGVAGFDVLSIERESSGIQGRCHFQVSVLFRISLRVTLFAGRIAFRNKLVAGGCGLLFVIVGYVVDRRACRAMELHALGIEHVFLRLM